MCYMWMTLFTQSHSKAVSCLVSASCQLSIARLCPEFLETHQGCTIDMQEFLNIHVNMEKGSLKVDSFKSYRFKVSL